MRGRHVFGAINSFTGRAARRGKRLSRRPTTPNGYLADVRQRTCVVAFAEAKIARVTHVVDRQRVGARCHAVAAGAAGEAGETGEAGEAGETGGQGNVIERLGTTRQRLGTMRQRLGTMRQDTTPRGAAPLGTERH